jgi:predicted protein tyrosine phosphatase
MSSHEIKIEVASRLEAGEILCTPNRCGEITYLVSIGDAYDQLPMGYENVERKSRLLIADVVTEEGATEEDVRQIIDLAEQLQGDSGTVLIHCEAGISRSTATALIIYTCWLGRGREREAMRRVIAQRPIAIPNRRMVRLADELLALDGRLVEALDTEVFY